MPDPNILPPVWPMPGDRARDPDGMVWDVGARGVTGGEVYVWLVNDGDVAMVPLIVVRDMYEPVEES